MVCASCRSELSPTNVFPGGAVRCPSCGASNTVAEADRDDLVAAPYRSPGSPSAKEPAKMTCPFCGGECVPSARACPHCDVKLSNVRCPTCFTLQATGRRNCARCGHELGLEPLLDASDAPCPRCSHTLDVVPGSTGMHECAACGGLFIDHPTLAQIAEDRERSGPLPVPDARPFELAKKAITEVDVRYVKCPLCHQPMNRLNFGKKSGVIVDVCKQHGTWFDSGELTRSVEWIASGGLEEARKQQDARRPSHDTEQDARAREAQAFAQIAMMNESMRETRDQGRRLVLTEDLVDAAIRALLWW